MEIRPQSFTEFWLHYLNQHRQRSCRLLHYLGTSGLLVLIGLAIAVSPWLLLLLPIVGYTPAWIGHFLIEKNRPATFGHPVWAALADFKMFALALTGRLGPHLAAADMSNATKINPRRCPPLQGVASHLRIEEPHDESGNYRGRRIGWILRGVRPASGGNRARNRAR